MLRSMLKVLCVCVCVISWQCRWLFLDYGVGRLVGLEDFIMVTKTQKEYLGCGFGVGRGKAEGRQEGGGTYVND